jgi:hypothetical protein
VIQRKFQTTKSHGEQIKFVVQKIRRIELLHVKNDDDPGSQKQFVKQKMSLYGSSLYGSFTELFFPDRLVQFHGSAKVFDRRFK